MAKSITDKRISDYMKFLAEKSRPPSRGGNAKALHSHVIIVDGIRYSFLAFDSKQWVFKTDTVSFEYEVKDGYNNIIKESIVTKDKNGNPIVRGNRGYKKQLRTVSARLPGSAREKRN
ncbi:hypothetical protein [Cronobacter sakazakii]|uniref:hypothetical protein n=1 Tax=Cronobacter sakazakii TaxID=28141 RepID=UPI000A11935B|nr:hypothetical protein [Cronobacter sakazakii]